MTVTHANAFDALTASTSKYLGHVRNNQPLRAMRPAPPPPAPSSSTILDFRRVSVPSCAIEILTADDSESSSASSPSSSSSCSLAHDSHSHILMADSPGDALHANIDRMPNPPNRTVPAQPAAALTTHVPILLAPGDNNATGRTVSYIENLLRHFRFNVGNRYKVCDVIGEGAYGVVCSAIHKATGQKVAIKKIQPFDHQMFALRTLRELKLLRYFQECEVSENIISILDIVKPSSFEQFQEVYLIQELMETDLHRVVRTQQLSDDHAQYFTYQILRALKAMHSADVIHRDLKPSNLLLNANCDLKVCDFGLARSILTAEPNGTETGFMTEYVATRWYRAPEIMLTFKQYTKAIDIWAVGCILAEMLTGRPLFPGRDYHHQLSLILDLLGTPTLDEFYNINSRRSREYIRALPFRKRKDFTAVFPKASPEAVDFLKRTLTFDPKRRLTVEEALAHPYLASYHDPEDEPTAPALDAHFFEFDLQKATITKEALKEEVWAQVQSFQPLI
ncbi:mitogen activated protein kinase [Tilletia horrida]|nr:mitogen activated protein kinase [Tilletia horrida]